MHPRLSALKARVSNRLARDFASAPHRMRNDGPMVSFTFDDIPKSAATTGAQLLREYNAQATFYVAGSLADQWSGHWDGFSAEDIVRLHHEGHEIACHTFSHLRTTDLGAATMAAEIEKNRRYLTALDPSIKIENFAYPFGLASVARKGQLRKTFRSSRGILPGVNSGIVDLQFLHAMPLTDEHIDHEGIDRAFDEAVAKNGWLIFYGHDVEDRPSPYGCTAQMLRHALDAAARRNIPAVSVANALQRAGA
jgi:peptidoglycan/xylan/chitin deacetylase (PgdA/CDA1 family)